MKQVRRLHLERDEDVSGVSGLGIVAYGAEFPDGSIVLRWDTKVASTVHYNSVQDLETIAGHGGRTRVVWDDEPVAQVQPVWPISSYSRSDVPTPNGSRVVHRASGVSHRPWGDLEVRPGVEFQIRVNNEPINMVVTMLASGGRWEAKDSESYHLQNILEDAVT